MSNEASDAYLRALLDFNVAARQAWKALHDAETMERTTGDGRREQTEQRRRQIDDSLRRASEARDLVLEVQERTGAGEVPRQIASAGLTFPNWETASDNLNASTSRLEQAEGDLREAEKDIGTWHEERGKRAKVLVWFAAGAMAMVVLLAFILDFARRFAFFSSPTLLLLLLGVVLTAAAGGTAAVLLKHPDVTEGPPLRTVVNFAGLAKLCGRVAAPAAGVFVVIRVLLGIVLTIASWLG